MKDGDLIASLQKKIAELESQILPIKQTVNLLCRAASRPEIYSVTDIGLELGSKPTLALRVDQFFNRPLATCVAEYLELLRDTGADGPATIDEIYDALCKGGYKFEGATGTDENNKRALKIAITKNTAQFVKIGERFGLKKWYGKRAQRKSSNSQSSTSNQANSVDEEPYFEIDAEDDDNAFISGEEDNNEDDDPHSLL